ncbi:tail fiber domain-containing protein [Citrobacter koseri]|uniref:tail fiber domain-containing protein n=1 Tax=Citrobacter koseri TaxID=545 RepID=UPI001F3206EE|nr:tail fiber domain-containing protein [Citrobacter koseri]
MSAGTLTLTNNSAAVTGSGTAFTTELAAGDFIVVTVGGVPYTLPIKTVNSNTSLTLVSNYTGPTQSGAAWSAVPRVALNMVTAALVAQSAEALRGLNYDKQNWQQLFSVNGNITVTLPDGSQFSGPSWLYMVNTVATKTNGAVPINQGGTGSTSASGARTGLGLGDVAVMNYNTHVRGGIPNEGQDAASFAAAIQGWSRISSLTTDSPDGLTWGNMYTVCSAGLRAGNADQSQGGWYWKQIYYSNTGNNIFHRTKVSTGNWSLWYQLTQSSVSDEALKNKGDPFDLEEALSNVNAMDFLHFTYKFDEKNTPRRGVISQQIMGIDPQYVKKVGEYYHLDETPMLLDGLAAIKALRKRDEDNKLRIQELESSIEELKRVVRELAESAS